MSGSSGSSGSSGGSTSSLAMQFDAHQMLKVPHEQLAQATRKRQKMVEKELAEVKEVIKATVESENDPGPTISGLVERLRGLKRKLEEGRAQEDELLQRCRMRFDYLQAADESEGSKKERLQRLIADYLLRQGHDDAARQLAQEAGIEPYLDFDLVLASRGVLASLRAKDCEPALAWCAEHRAKLKKAGSTLELQLRLQQFVELVRAGRQVEALEYARKHLSSRQEIEPQLRQAMGALALGPATAAGTPYSELFDVAAWERLAERFQNDQYTVLAMPATAPLVVALSAGLIALKTPACLHPENHNRECPVCNEPFQGIARALPSAQRSQSSLVCRLSGQPMNEDNPPLVLPSGNVYSQQALLARAGADGVLSDPATQELVRVDQLRKAFFM
eukprot:Transcript_29527.p1 GENE.Transcript_29527~~Transcript_29527.p1  ORF type:complete len:391 (+),score=143.28 Transcript_29527:61-1233(+)